MVTEVIDTEEDAVIKIVQLKTDIARLEADKLEMQGTIDGLTTQIVQILSDAEE